MSMHQIISDLYEEEESNCKTNEVLIKSSGISNKNSLYFNKYINLDMLDIDHLDQSLKTLNRIVVYVRKIIKSKPKILSNDQDMFWNETISPMMNQTLFHEAQARQIIRKGFDIISVQAKNTIECCNVEQYNQDHIKLFKKFSLDNLKTLNMCCNQVNSLATESLFKFSKFTNIIFNVIGPEPALYMDKQALLETKIKQYKLKQDKIQIELDYKKGNLQALEKSINELSRRIKIIKIDQDRILKIIKNFFLARNSLKKLFKKQQKKSSSCYKLTKIKTRLIKNKLNIIKYKNENCQLEQKLNGLNAELKKHQQEFENIKIYLDNIEPVYEKNLANYQDKAEKSRFELDKILSRKEFVQNNIGLNGLVLIEFLTLLRLFAKDILKTTTIYSTINSILNEIKSSIQCPIELLNSSHLSNILIGQNMLYDQAHSLLSYSRDARRSIANNHHKRCWLIDINNKETNNLI